MYEDVLTGFGGRRKISAKNFSQRRYVEMIQENDLVFSIGPAGTGKTYLAMAMALAAFGRREVARVVLTRPAVEAGEKLGFLPGSMAEKVNPYLRPLYDALHDMMDFEKAARLIERGIIEVAPLAFMRGRTLNDSFVILDEAQNTTPEQMKMFLTRLGYHSKAVVTGDVTQIDLPTQQPSGLVDARRVLGSVDEIGFMYFTEADVVRHPLVQSIIAPTTAATTEPRVDPREVERLETGAGPGTAPIPAEGPTVVETGIAQGAGHGVVLDGPADEVMLSPKGRADLLGAAQSLLRSLGTPRVGTVRLSGKRPGNRGLERGPPG